MITSSMKSLGHPIEASNVVLNSIPITLIAYVLCLIYNHMFDQKLKNKKVK